MFRAESRRYSMSCPRVFQITGSKQPSWRRVPPSMSGVTLVELLIVVSIITILAAATLPTFRTVLDQRKTTQAAMLVRNMLESARSRAVANGRPVAVVLERLSSRVQRDPSDATKLISITASTNADNNFSVYNTSIRLSLAEVPKPAEFGDIQFKLNGNLLTLQASVPDARLTQLLDLGAQVIFPEVAVISRPLLITEVIDRATGEFKCDNFPTLPADALVWVDARVKARAAIYPKLPIIPPLTITPPNTTPKQEFSAATKMLIYSPPKPVSSQIVDLPRGTCIDLSLSGYGTDNVSTGGTTLRDARRLFASNWSFSSAAPNPSDLRPIYVSFGPDGVLESVYANGLTATGGSSFSINHYEAQDDVFLLVGRTDQIIASPTATADDYSPTNVEDLGIKSNFSDASANWIRISPTSGSIAIAPITPITDLSFSLTDPIGQLLYQSRASSFVTEGSAQ